jgi:hypothetical protein
MRVSPAVVILVLGAAGMSPASAADLRINGVGAGHVIAYNVVGARAAPLIIYDYEPGVVVRAYWLPPWRHRHYFPVYRDPVKVHAAVRPRPAQTYQRYWSNDWAFRNEFSPPALRALDMAPPANHQDHLKPVKPRESPGP